MHQPNEVLFYIGTYNSEEREAILLGALDKESGEMRVMGGTRGSRTLPIWRLMRRRRYYML